MDTEFSRTSVVPNDDGHVRHNLIGRDAGNGRGEAGGISRPGRLTP